MVQLGHCATGLQAPLKQALPLPHAAPGVMFDQAVVDVEGEQTSQMLVGLVSFVSYPTPAIVQLGMATVASQVPALQVPPGQDLPASALVHAVVEAMGAQT